MPIRFEGKFEGIGTDRRATIGEHWNDRMFAKFYPGFRPGQSGNALIASIAWLSLVLFTSY
jgi:hypothetical protein